MIRLLDKILFLDFDGVLNDSSHYNIPKELFDSHNSRAFRESRNYIYDMLKEYDSKELCLQAISDLEYDKVMLLNRIVRDTDCKIVFSTSWRNSGTKLLALYLSIVGFRYPLNCIDCTPRLKDRGQEINKWLSENACIKYAILDDEMFDILDYHNKECMFKTDGANSGLTEEIANDIIKFLNS